MTTGDAQYSLVLLGRYPGKDRPVAHTLSREFGMNEAWGLQVVGAAPIIMLDALTAEQAQLVHEALAEVEAAGSKFEVQYGQVEGMSKISWPGPPRIRGHPVAEFGAPAGKPALTIVVPCPYTGQKMKLTISVQVSRLSESGVAMPAAAAAPMAPVSISPPIPVPPPAMSMPSNARPPSRGNIMPSMLPSIPTPVAMPAVRAPAGPPIPVPVPAVQSSQHPHHPRQPTPPQEVAPPVMGLESLEELIPMEQFPPAAPKVPQRSPQHGTAVAPRGPAASAPLPDVPILHNSPAPPMAPAELPPMPSPLVNAPMDLEVFEQRVSSSGTFKAPVIPEEAAAEGADGGLCSVFMGKSNNGKIHQLLAEVQGISQAEAAKLCQKPIVPVAKDISSEDALQIKQRFAALNVNVRIAKRK